MKPAYKLDKLKYGGVFVGLQIRRDIGKVKTFRVRTGNGHYGSKLGVKYQDQYDYNVSDPNADHCGNVNKDKFAAGSALWNALSADEKLMWKNVAAARHLNMTGYNLYMKGYLLSTL